MVCILVLVFEILKLCRVCVFVSYTNRQKQKIQAIYRFRNMDEIPTGRRFVNSKTYFNLMTKINADYIPKNIFEKYIILFLILGSLGGTLFFYLYLKKTLPLWLILYKKSGCF